MLTEPHTDTADAGKRGEGASARIDPAPRGRPGGSAAKHIVQMHHEVVLQKLGVALLLKTALVELLAIGRAPLRREGNLLRWFAIERDGSRRRIKDTCRLPSKARLASPRSPRPARSVGRLDLGEHRRDSYRRFIYGLGRGGLLVHRPGAGCRDVQSHHSVAREVAARGGLLRDDQPDQLRLAAERTIKAGAQPGPHPRRAGRHTRPPPGGPRGRLGGCFSRAESRAAGLRFCCSSLLLTTSDSDRPTNFSGG